MKAPTWNRRSKNFLSAALAVLTEAARPMTLREIVEEIDRQGLFHSAAKTPESTLYSLIWRENERRSRAGGRPVLVKAVTGGPHRRALWLLGESDG